MSVGAGTADRRGAPVGRLAIWNDCAAGHEAAYEAWYQHEHLPERLAVPGFRRGRRFAGAGTPAFFTYYETDDPSVLEGPAYLARVDDPTPQTRFIMAQVFLNMSRTACRLIAGHGRCRGGWAATVQLDAAPDAALLAGVAALVEDPGIARAEAWAAAGESRQSTESRLRGGDRQVAGCLLVETVRESDARAALERLGTPGQAGVFQLLSELERERP